jgi:hypothetical protein
MLNWRRDPGFELRKMQHEQRMKQLESDILRVRSDREQIEKEIEQLDHENAKEEAFSDSMKQLCFPPESSSIPQASTAPDYKPS